MNEVEHMIQCLSTAAMVQQVYDLFVCTVGDRVYTETARGKEAELFVMAAAEMVKTHNNEVMRTAVVDHVLAYFPHNMGKPVGYQSSFPVELAEYIEKEKNS